MRVFIGIKLSSKYKNKIGNIKGYLYEMGVKGNFTDDDNIHLTLAFLGEVNEVKINELKDIVDSLDVDDLVITISKITVMKSYIIFEVDKNEKLMFLQKELIYKLKEKGFTYDEKEYYPHITLVRKFENLNCKVLDNINKNVKMESVVEKVNVFESKRINNKLKYVVL